MTAGNNCHTARINISAVDNVIASLTLGQRPVTAIWYLTRTNGSYQVYNMRVAGINLTLNQAQDFDSYIQRNGFDRLVSFMRQRGA